MGQKIFLKEIEKNIDVHRFEEITSAVFVLHDQLNLNKWPDRIIKEKPLLIFIESEAKNRALPYHKKKLVYKLSSMRHFAVACTRKGYPVLYQTASGYHEETLRDILEEHEDLNITFMMPSEWNSRERLRNLQQDFPERIEEIQNGFFIAEPDQWKDTIESGYRMEYFYREMRRKTGYLMRGDEPEGGEWNYDEQNRESLPEGYQVPKIPVYDPDEITMEVINLVEEEYPDHFGSIDGFGYAVTRKQALQLLDDFIENRLKDFGPYEDAMATSEPTLFHSTLSPYLNNGLLLPREICERAIKAYEEGEAPINSVEGLVRQIIGWREFVRVYYEAMMPDVREANFMNFGESLPEMYWSGDTRLHCMQQSLKPVIGQGYSHHIQRLMILSNFSNLTGTDPRELNRWFWLAYVDAYEWVVLPNVLGMSTFADGGILASKPYVSSGNYINKMSNYCNSCTYSISKKTGENACPFNYLYWNFVDEQREAFEQSGRNSFMVGMFEKKSEEDKNAIRESTGKFLNELKRSND